MSNAYSEVRREEILHVYQERSSMRGLTFRRLSWIFNSSSDVKKEHFHAEKAR